MSGAFLLAAPVFAAESSASAEAKPPPPAPPMISRSGQFFVYSPDDNWSVRFVVHADAVRAFVREQLGDTGAGHPMLVIVHGENVPPELRGVAQVTVRPVPGAQTYFILNLHLPMSAATMLKALIELVAVESINRNKRWDANAQLHRPPLWWLEGAAETFREDLHDSHQQFLARVWNESPPTPASKIIASTTLPEDPLERAYFVAQCGVFFRCLADSPDGPALMRAMLRRANEGDNEWNSFRNATAEMFPTERALEKWWALQCAAYSRLASAGFLGAEDSLLTLKRLLAFNLALKQKDSDSPAQPVTLRIDELAGHHKHSDVRLLIRDRSTRLRLFATQTHPFYKPAALAYAEALELVHAGNLRAFRDKLLEARQWLDAAESYDRRVRAWMNEVETETRGDAGRLLPFIEVIGRGRELDRQRTNRIKKFMDDAEKELSP